MAGNARRRGRRRVWLDLFLGAVTIGFLGLVAQRVVLRSNAKADQAIVAHEARQLYAAFVRFHEQNGRYPEPAKTAAFDRESLDPLRRRGYYDGSVTQKLQDHRVDGYVATDRDGQNQEFWMEMSLAVDPSIRFLVSRSDDAPLCGGKWREGAFVYRDGKLRPL